MSTEKEDEYSWIWHPFYGTFSKPGYMQHDAILHEFPELRLLPKYNNGHEDLIDYDPPRGYAIVNKTKKQIRFVRYDQSRFNTKGTKDTASQTDVEAQIKTTYKLTRYECVFLGEQWWHK